MQGERQPQTRSDLRRARPPLDARPAQTARAQHHHGHWHMSLERRFRGTPARSACASPEMVCFGRDTSSRTSAAWSLRHAKWHAAPGPNLSLTCTSKPLSPHLAKGSHRSSTYSATHAGVKPAVRSPVLSPSKSLAQTPPYYTLNVTLSQHFQLCRQLFNLLPTLGNLACHISFGVSISARHASSSMRAVDAAGERMPRKYTRAAIHPDSFGISSEFGCSAALPQATALQLGQSHK